jgi:ribosomal protein S27E
MMDRCPGSANVRTPTLKIKECPECGKEIEIFSNDKNVVCANCGFILYNDITSCAKWCRYAKECLGDELYRTLSGEGG